jgi:hypothetical protein
VRGVFYQAPTFPLLRSTYRWTRILAGSTQLCSTDTSPRTWIRIHGVSINKKEKTYWILGPIRPGLLGPIRGYVSAQYKRSAARRKGGAAECNDGEEEGEVRWRRSGEAARREGERLRATTLLAKEWIW